MAKATTVTLNKNHFSAEVTQGFLQDFDRAISTMEAPVFEYLFKKYDLHFIEDFGEIATHILDILSSWKREGQDPKLESVTVKDAQCLFCNIGKKVKVYSWTYSVTKGYNTRIHYKNEIAFLFEYENNCLINFGYCNMYH